MARNCPLKGGPAHLFYEELKKHVAEDDAIIIFKIGWEKLRYLTGYATVITSYGIKRKVLVFIIL